MSDPAHHPQSQHYRVIAGPIGRGRIVEVFPYTGANAAELLAWMGPDVDAELRPDVGIAVHLACVAGTVMVVPGDWVVRVDDLCRPLTPWQVGAWLRRPYNW